MAFHSDGTIAVNIPKIPVAVVVTLVLATLPVIGAYSVLQHRVNVLDTQVAAFNDKLTPVITDVAVVREQVKTTSEAVARIEKKLDQ